MFLHIVLRMCHVICLTYQLPDSQQTTNAIGAFRKPFFRHYFFYYAFERFLYSLFFRKIPGIRAFCLIDWETYWNWRSWYCSCYSVSVFDPTESVYHMDDAAVWLTTVDFLSKLYLVTMSYSYRVYLEIFYWPLTTVHVQLAYDRFLYVQYFVVDTRLLQRYWTACLNGTMVHTPNQPPASILMTKITHNTLNK